MKHWLFVLVLASSLLAGCNLQPQMVDNPPTSLEPQATNWKMPGANSLNINPNQSAYGSTLAIGNSDNPVVSWSEFDGISYNIYVKRWNGSSWVQLGTILDVNASQNASTPSLVLLDTANNPMVSWSESDGVSDNIYVKKWNGTSWVQLGTILDANTNQNANTPSLALDSDGNPFVSWSESEGVSKNIYVKWWDGSSWNQLGTILDTNANRNADTPSLALNSSDYPIVSWSESDGSSNNIYVKRWNGNSWTQVGTILDANVNQSATSPSLALDNLNIPNVSWSESDGLSSFNVYVKRWNGSSWVQLGTILDVDASQNARNPKLALDTSGNPVVGWFENDLSHTSYVSYVKRWIDNSWQQLGGSIQADPRQPSSIRISDVALDSVGRPSTTFISSEGASNKAYIAHWNGLAWAPNDTALNFNLSAAVYNSSIARRSDDKPVVAWTEQYIGGPSNFDTNIYVKEWTGSAWNLLSGQVNHLGKSGVSPSLAVRTDNKPVVAYAEREPTSESSFVYVRRWDGLAWQDIGHRLTSPTSIRGLSLALDSSNTPIVAFATCPASCSLYVKKWNGSSWVGMDGSATPAPVYDGFITSLALALSSTGKPSVVWAGDIFSPSVNVKRWNGSSWVQLGTNVTPVLSDGVSIAVEIKSNNPVVTYMDTNLQSDTQTLYVKRWNGTTWVNYGSGAALNPTGTSAYSPSLKLRSNNQPVVAYGERNASSHFDAYVKRWNGTTWVTIADSLNYSPSESASQPSLVLKSNNNPIVSWIETRNVYVKEY
jgi:hypothetical protein